MRKKYFCEDAATLASVIDFLEESKLANCPQRFRIIKYLLRNADENGIIRTTYQKVTSDLSKHGTSIELNSVGSTFRKLMKAGLITMTRTNRRTKILTEYEVRKDVLHAIVSKNKPENDKNKYSKE